MTQYLIREIQDSTGYVHRHVSKVRENEYMNVVEAGSEDEALEKCGKEDKVIEKTDEKYALFYKEDTEIRTKILATGTYEKMHGLFRNIMDSLFEYIVIGSDADSAELYVEEIEKGKDEILTREGHLYD